MHNLSFQFLGLALILGLAAGCASNQPPAESPEGLVLQPDSKFDAVYVRPGASLQGYGAFGVTGCEVSFRRNWLRDQNMNRIDLSRRVTQEDVDRIKDALAEECVTHLREALLEEPAYNLTADFENGEPVLVLHPSIINLDISAPDTMSPDMTRSYTTTAGEMTLILELKDATTGELLARVIDRERDFDSGRVQWTNSVTNRAAAKRALSHWSRQLREGLDRATGR